MLIGGSSGSVGSMDAECQGGRKRALDPLELELQPPFGAGSRLESSTRESVKCSNHWAKAPVPILGNLAA